MKRFLVFVAMMLCSQIGFAGYPDGYAGDTLPDGCIEVEAWITDWHDMEPWGQPDPTGNYYLMGDLCVEDGVAVLDFREIAWRRCTEAPWGTIGDPPVCNAWYVGGWSGGRHVLAYDLGVYVSGIWREDPDGQAIYSFDALTWDEDKQEATFTQGVWLLDVMWYLDDDRYTRTRWLVRKRQAQYQNRQRVSMPKSKRR